MRYTKPRRTDDDICLLVEGNSPEENATELEEAVATCFMWGKENAVAFDDPKSELMHYFFFFFFYFIHTACKPKAYGVK